MKEVVIGTSDTQDALHEAPALASPIADDDVCGPSIAEVELHVSKLRRLLIAAETPQATVTSSTTLHHSYSNNKSSSSASHEAATCTVVTIEANELERLATVCDMLDQVYYWAIEEANNGKDGVPQPSLLAQAELPEVVYGCVCSDRPRLVSQALRVAAVLLRHPQSAAELCRVAEQCSTKGDTSATYSTSNDNEEETVVCAMGRYTRGMLPILNTLRTVMERFPAAATALTEAMRVLVALLERPIHIHCVVVETLVHYHAGLIAHIVQALRSHRDCPALQVAACTCLARIVAIAQDNRLRAISDLNNCNDDNDGETDVVVQEEWDVGLKQTPVALLFAHSAVLCDTLFDTLRCYPGQSDIARAVLEFIRGCASGYRESGEALMQHGAYALAMHVWQSSMHSAEMFALATETVAYLVPLLDCYQQRTLLVLLRDLLVHRAEREVLMLGLALLHAVFRQLRQARDMNSTTHSQKQNKGTSNGGREEKETREGEYSVACQHRNEAISMCGEAFAMYRCYPQPPSPTTRRAADEQHSPAHSKTVVELRCSPRMDHLNYADNVRLIYDACIPQLIGHVMDYYGTLARTAEEDADAVAAAESLRRVAAEVLTALPAMPFPH